MYFYSNKELKKLGFKNLGKNLQISKNVNFYNFSGSVGSNCRIDDFSILIGKINIGNHVHIAPHNLISASKYSNTITISDFSGIGPRCYISASTEDYMANDISNPTIKKKFRKNIIMSNIKIGKNVLMGAGTHIIPRRKNKDIEIGDNVSIGVNTVISISVASNSLVFNQNLHKIKILPIKKKINFNKIKF
jgi:acetyltransferase-like isoleucine patch superfamily enzyme